MSLSTLGWDGGWAQALADHQDRALVPARVTAVHRGLCAVRCDDMNRLVPAAGALEAAARGPAELPATGDWVALRGGEAIRHVLPRMASSAGVQDASADVTAAAAGCRFADCRHDGEPGCGVAAALAAGELAPAAWGRCASSSARGSAPRALAGVPQAPPEGDPRADAPPDLTAMRGCGA